MHDGMMFDSWYLLMACELIDYRCDNNGTGAKQRDLVVVFENTASGTMMTWHWCVSNWKEGVQPIEIPWSIPWMNQQLFPWCQRRWRCFMGIERIKLGHARWACAFQKFFHFYWERRRYFMDDDRQRDHTTFNISKVFALPFGWKTILFPSSQPQTIKLSSIIRI